jgi:hypothetical protein
MSSDSYVSTTSLKEVLKKGEKKMVMLPLKMGSPAAWVLGYSELLINSFMHLCSAIREREQEDPNSDFEKGLVLEAHMVAIIYYTQDMKMDRIRKQAFEFNAKFACV